MGKLEDKFSKADVLDSMAWTILPFKARVARLANYYLDVEGKVDDNCRDYDGPSVRTVRVVMKSRFTPARGEGVLTIKSTIKEIKRQRKIQEDREGNQPWQWKRHSLQTRRNAVAKRRYTIRGTDYRGDPTKESPNCVGITRINGNLVMVDGGGYRTDPRVYLRNIESGQVKVVVLKTNSTVKSITGALTTMAPKKTLRQMFEGRTVSLDFDREGYVIDGEFVAWRRVKKVYQGAKSAHKTRKRADG
jgi:hypothetical protein